MAGTETRQLLLQVDASVAVAQRQLRSLAQSVQQDSGSIEKSLARVDTAHQRLGGTLGNTRIAMLELGHVARGATDQFAAGTPLTQILTQHLAQLGQAASLAGDSFGKFGAFMGGPWGLLITLGVVALAKLSSGTDDAVKSVEQLVAKMREQYAQAANNRIADELWKHTIEGLTDAIRKRREEQERSLKTDVQQEQSDLASARRDGDELLRKRNALQTQVNVLRNEIKELRSRPVDPDDAIGASDQLGQLAQKQRRLTHLEADLRIANSGIPAAQANIRSAEIPIDERAVADSLDKSKAAADAYTAALGRLNEAKQKGEITRQQYRTQLAEAQKTRDAAIEADRASKRGSRDSSGGNTTSGFNLPVSGARITGQFGESRPGHQHAGVDLAVPVGTRVGAAAAGTVIEAGNLPGYGNVVIIDHGGGTITRYGHLSQIAARKGQQVGQGDEIGLSGGARGAPGSGDSKGPHVHFEVRRNGRAVNPLKGSYPTDAIAAGSIAARSAQSAADKSLHADNTGRLELDRAQDELRSAQAALITDIKERARLAEEDVKRDLQRQKDSAEAAVSEHRITRAVADKEIATRETTAQIKLQGIALQRTRDLDRQSVDIANTRLQTDADHLRALDELAVSTTEHRDIQRRIVLDMSQIEINAAELALRSAEASKNEGAILIAQDLLAAAYQHKADALLRTDRQNPTPGQAYLQSLRDQDKGMQDRLDQIKVQGLDSLNQGLVEAIMGTKSLGSVFHDISKQIIADLLQIAIRKAVIEPLANALFGGGGGGGGGLGGLLGSIAGLFGGGGGGGGMSFGGFGNSLGAASYNFAGARAGGGPVSAGSAYLVGERGPEIVVPRQSSVVIPNGKGMGGSRNVTINVDARDAVLASQVQQMVLQGMAAATDAGSDLALAKSGRINRRMIP